MLRIKRTVFVSYRQSQAIVPEYVMPMDRKPKLPNPEEAVNTLKLAVVDEVEGSVVQINEDIDLPVSEESEEDDKMGTAPLPHCLAIWYKSKDDLDNYLGHPAHLRLVNESIDPICDDVLLVDWVADVDEPLIVPSPGSVMRVSLLKLKQGSEESEKAEVLKVMGGVKEQFGIIDEYTFGENFAPVKTNGFSIASLAIVPGLSELEALDSNEVVKEQKEKVKDLLEGVIVVDYVVPPTESG
ncbi:Stress-response A/B barrel domain-containing protein UP3 [Thalictrum thalictroides]|uniref:Stress-response A/B barrel domain-containing protein UP3 n=1 Tax=Thalictrum thalictroides TaxID=46969 RepID=A0A7J6VLE5_THATH|nr:Stress-response A/B barrel domain-containing protein UP3 [Thalictrum thalictroides]